MATTSISLATDPRDIAAVQQLCRDFVVWQLEVFPEKKVPILTYFEPVKWEKTLAELPQIHARPKGAIILAKLGEIPVGCIMYHQLEPGVAEVKRLFVSGKARGIGVGSKLVEKMLELIWSDGYQEVRLETANFLTNARKLYAKHGFIEQECADDLPKKVRDIAIFMHRMI